IAGGCSSIKHQRIAGRIPDLKAIENNALVIYGQFFLVNGKYIIEHAQIEHCFVEKQVAVYCRLACRARYFKRPVYEPGSIPQCSCRKCLCSGKRQLADVEVEINDLIVSIIVAIKLYIVVVSGYGYIGVVDVFRSEEH